MARIFMVRHAEPAALWGAQPDPGLSVLGRSQAETVATHLVSLGVSKLITSPLARCRETALPTQAALRQEAIVNQAVAEIPVPDDVDNHRAWLTAVMSGAWSDGHVGGALRTWREEIGQTLMALTQDTIIFSHFVAINAAVGLAMGSDHVTVFKPGHTSVTVLESDGEVLRLVEFGAEGAINLA